MGVDVAGSGQEALRLSRELRPHLHGLYAGHAADPRLLALLVSRRVLWSAAVQPLSRHVGDQAVLEGSAAVNFIFSAVHY